MATSNRVGGVLSLKVDGNQYEALFGSFRVTPSESEAR